MIIIIIIIIIIIMIIIIIITDITKYFLVYVNQYEKLTNIEHSSTYRHMKWNFTKSYTDRLIFFNLIFMY